MGANDGLFLLPVQVLIMRFPSGHMMHLHTECEQNETIRG